MTDSWINDCGAMSGIHLLNFSSFLAKLAFTCVCKDRMCQVALVLFRRTFEERQVLRSSGDPGDPDDEDPHRSMDSLEIRHLLPSATAWLREADCNILQLSEVSWNDCPSAIGKGGRCFIESKLGKRSPTGFTPWRWLF